jgi:hypothetical protein
MRSTLVLAGSSKLSAGVGILIDQSNVRTLKDLVGHGGGVYPVVIDDFPRIAKIDIAVQDCVRCVSCIA